MLSSSVPSTSGEQDHYVHACLWTKEKKKITTTKSFSGSSKLEANLNIMAFKRAFWLEIGKGEQERTLRPPFCNRFLAIQEHKEEETLGQYHQKIAAELMLPSLPIHQLSQIGPDQNAESIKFYIPGFVWK